MADFPWREAVTAIALIGMGHPVTEHPHLMQTADRPGVD